MYKLVHSKLDIAAETQCPWHSITRVERNNHISSHVVKLLAITLMQVNEQQKSSHSAMTQARYDIWYMVCVPITAKNPMVAQHAPVSAHSTPHIIWLAFYGDFGRIRYLLPFSRTPTRSRCSCKSTGPIPTRFGWVFKVLGFLHLLCQVAAIEDGLSFFKFQTCGATWRKQRVGRGS